MKSTEGPFLDRATHVEARLSKLRSQVEERARAGLTVSRQIARELSSCRRELAAIQTEALAYYSGSQAPAAFDALTEAVDIALRAQLRADFEEIDWTRDPLTDRERDNRAVLIRHVETVNNPEGADAVIEALHRLLPLAAILEDDDERVEMGCDLALAIDRAREAALGSVELERYAENWRTYRAAQSNE